MVSHEAGVRTSQPKGTTVGAAHLSAAPQTRPHVAGKKPGLWAERPGTGWQRGRRALEPSRGSSGKATPDVSLITLSCTPA